ncbi:MAG: sulfatase-like hydrolase/transferase, partial [Myxococcota bacterium]
SNPRAPNAYQRILSGAKSGAVLGAVYGLADLGAAAIAVGALFDPGWPSFVLIAFTLSTVVFLGAALGAVAGFIPISLSAKVKRVGLIAIAFSVFVAGIVARYERNHELTAVQKADSEAKSVLFVVVDTTRSDTLYGSDYEFSLAPNTGEWAKDALLFEDAESTAGWTIPSMAAMLTGVHNATFDASAGRLPLWGTTLAEYLRDQGYETRAVVDNVILEPRNGFAQGFESFDQRSAFRFAFTFPAFRLWPIEVHEWLRGAVYSAYDGSTDVTDQAIRRLQHAQERPLLLYVHYMDPHAPYYQHSDQPDVSGESVNYYRFRDYLREGVDKPPNPSQLSWLRGRYEQEVRHWDRDFGRLLAAWRKKFGEDGLIVLTSDHGEEFLDHGRLGHGMTVHREMVHVPLLIDGPECERTGRVPQLVSTLDLTPTVVHWATGRTIPQPLEGPKVQGVSLRPWLCEGEAPPVRPAFARHSRHGRRVFRFRRGDEAAIRVRYFDDAQRVENQRYDLATDPAEQKPLGVGGELQQSFDQLTVGFERAYDASKETEDSKAVEESLRALGYIQ